MSRKGFRQSGRGRRRGAVIVIVILLLFVVVGVAGAMLRTLVSEQRQFRSLHQQHQAAWLAESGLQRAVARLRDAADYTGETWSVPADALGGDRSGRVEIRVERIADQPRQRRVHALAEFPVDPVHRKRCSLTVVVTAGRPTNETEDIEP